MDDNPKETILVVDDEEWVRTALDRLLTSNGYSVETIKLGAFDYLMKPLDSKRILLTVR